MVGAAASATGRRTCRRGLMSFAVRESGQEVGVHITGESGGVP